MSGSGGTAERTGRRVRLLLAYGEIAGAAELLLSLPSEKYHIVSCPLTASTEGWVGEFGPDLLLLSPSSDPEQLLEICESVRAQTERPVVVASEMREDSLVSRAFATGIDEFLVLPIGSQELTARIEAILRRPVRNQELLHGVRQIGNLVLRANDNSVDCDGQRISLSPTEFRLLSCLTATPGRVLTHQTLMSRVWGAEYVDSRHYLRLYVRYLREKLEKDPTKPRMIVSEWGVGYRFRPSQATMLAGS